MHLLIDGQALQTTSSRQRGIGRYSSNLLRALADARPGWRIEVVQNTFLAPIAAEDRKDLPLLSFQPPLRHGGKRCEVNERYYADWLTAQGADGVLILSPCESWQAVVPLFHGPWPRVFGIAYDLIPLLFSEQYFRDVRTANWFAHRFRQLLSSDVLLAISEATSRDVRILGGEDAPLVVNIAGAVDPLFAPLSPDELVARAGQLRQRFDLQREFLLYVGATDYRKNLHGAIRAFAALAPEHRTHLDLAVVCRMHPGERAAVEETARQAGVASELRLLCSAGDEELRALYQMCRLFFFPSLYEGLGLPVLEALHCGAPVVTSNCSSLPEYAGTVSWLGDPTSAQAMAQVLQQALAEPRDARRAEREAFARTFSWQRTAERACAVMERTMKRANSPVRRRPRLAWVMPLMPGTPGMSELLPFLGERFEIEVIAITRSIQASEIRSPQYLFLTAQEVPARHAAQPYDMFVYQWSPLPEHQDMRHLLKRFPGLLALNDFSPHNLKDLIDDKLLARRDHIASLKGLKPEADDFAPILGVLVHSPAVWQQLRRDLTVPVVQLAKASPTPQLADAYAAWIEQAIVRFQQSDGLWRGFALDGLADRPDAARTVIDSWAKLRMQAWQRTDKREDGVADCLPPAAA